MPEAINIEVLVKAGEDDVQKAAKILKRLMKRRKELKIQEEEIAEEKQEIAANMLLQLALLEEDKVEFDGVGTCAVKPEQTRTSLRKDKLIRNLVDHGMSADVVNQIIEESSTTIVIAETVEFRKAKE